MKLIHYLALSAFLWSAALSILSPVEALYLEGLSSDYFLIGIALGMGSLGALLLSPIIGRFSDKHGRKEIILVFAFVGAIVPLLLLYSPTIEIYATVKLLAGVASVLSAVLYAYVGDLIEERKDGGFVFGIYLAGASLGGALGSLASGYVASFVGGLSASYILASLISFASFACLLPLARSSEQVSGGKPKQGERISLWRLHPMVFVILALAFVYVFHMSIKSLLWPTIVGDFVEESLVPFYVSIIFALMGILTGVLSPYIGKLGDRKGNVNTYFFGSVLIGIFGMMLALPNAFLPFLIISLLYAFGETVKGPSGNTIISKFTSNGNRGFVFGLLFSLNGLASFLGPTITGYLMAFLGWKEILLLYGFIMLSLAVVLWFAVARKYR